MYRLVILDKLCQSLSDCTLICRYVVGLALTTLYLVEEGATVGWICICLEEGLAILVLVTKIYLDVYAAGFMTRRWDPFPYSEGLLWHLLVALRSTAVALRRPQSESISLINSFYA